jgi:hypothetical protein
LDISYIFLALSAYMVSKVMEKLTPRKGFIGRWLNCWEMKLAGLIKGKLRAKYMRARDKL